MTSEELEKALQRAFRLGERHWQLKDSERIGDWEKANTVYWEFQRLIETTKERCNDKTNK